MTDQAKRVVNDKAVLTVLAIFDIRDYRIDVYDNKLIGGRFKYFWKVWLLDRTSDFRPEHERNIICQTIYYL